MRRRWMWVGLWCALAPAVGLAARRVPAEEPVDHLMLAARLIGDGYWDRAERALAEVDTDDEALDRARFFTLSGLVSARAGRHEQAVEAFGRALVLDGVDALVNLHLAQSLLALGRHVDALQALDDAGEAGDAVVGAWLLRARAHVSLADRPAAWAALERASARFPADDEVTRQRLFLMIELGLYQAALADGRPWLERSGDDPTGWLALGEALRQAGESEEAIVLLEEARLRFPLRSDVAAQLGRLYLETDRPRAAGEILAVASEQDPSLLEAAAEAFRRAGQPARALYFNGRVPDPVARARQRLGLYAELADWARAVALEERLERLGLTAEDPVRYALAYGWFQLGDVERASGWLDGISDPRWFRDATTLREAMARCADGWSCP